MQAFQRQFRDQSSGAVGTLARCLTSRWLLLSGMAILALYVVGALTIAVRSASSAPTTSLGAASHSLGAPPGMNAALATEMEFLRSSTLRGVRRREGHIMSGPPAVGEPAVPTSLAAPPPPAPSPAAIPATNPDADVWAESPREAKAPASTDSTSSSSSSSSASSASSSSPTSSTSSSAPATPLPASVLDKSREAVAASYSLADPPVQKAGLVADSEWQEKVRDMFRHAWGAYRAHAWGKDNLRPLSKTADDGFLHMGITITDSLDTMWLMGLKEEFAAARAWVASSLHFDFQEDINLFETTIRVLGGLLAAYDMTRDAMFLDKARDLADRLSIAFDSPTGIPYGTLGLRTKRKYNPSWGYGGSTMAEVATLQLEWEWLSYATGDPKYAQFVRRVTRHLREHEPVDSLYPMFIRPDTGAFADNTITLGARGDSTYEYFIKQWVLAGGLRGQGTEGPRTMGNPAMEGKVAGTESEFEYFQSIRGMYDRSAQSVDEHLVRATTASNLLYIAERHGRTLQDKMDHLVCFAGAMYALGARGATRERHLELARRITETCHAMYTLTPVGLAPEIVRFPDQREMVVDEGSRHCLLRPETAESYFVLYRVTGDEIYREWGREMINALNQHARIGSGGFASINDVKQMPVTHRDHQESFFLAETLKYLFLLFSDGDLVPLDKFVFNTEAHPLSIFPPVH